ncbi:MAG: hypothetical protein IJ087_03435 [Eggerthellaceae bacterium]|nr:hypothetical protein [Eggerthellaceae bacterium]
MRTRRHDKLKGLVKLDFIQFEKFGHFASIAPFSDIFFKGKCNDRLEVIRDLLPAGILGMSNK